MNHRNFRSALPPALMLAALCGVSGGARAASDYPTADRVIFVQECMQANPGPYFEMVNKCSCAIDALAAEVKYDEFTTMQTISNGMSLGGDRGGVIRDSPTLQPELKKYRELQTKVKKGCFINDPK
jgi:hypothetical protein